MDSAALSDRLNFSETSDLFVLSAVKLWPAELLSAHWVHLFLFWLYYTSRSSVCQALFVRFILFFK